MTRPSTKRTNSVKRVRGHRPPDLPERLRRVNLQYFAGVVEVLTDEEHLGEKSKVTNVVRRVVICQIAITVAVDGFTCSNAIRHACRIDGA